MINRRLAFIVGIKGTKLSNREILFLKTYKPWGIILFSRNIKTIYQTQKLTKHIKKIFHDKHYPIIVDEEGGKETHVLKLAFENCIFYENHLFQAFLLLSEQKKV